MAKSIRSKRRRKLRAIKRVRYGKKELERLKQTLGINQDKEMREIPVDEQNDVETVVEGNVIEFSLKEKKEKKVKTNPRLDFDKMKIGEAEALLKENEKMDVVSENDVKKLGYFPKWMNQRQIQKISRAMKRNKRKLKRFERKKKAGKRK